MAENHADALDEQPTTRRAVAVGWAVLIGRLVARGYLVFVLALAACALAPSVFGLTGSVVMSGSMEPHVEVGDVVLVRDLPADAETPLGRVITFSDESASGEPEIRLHRLVEIDEDGTLITAGDANRDVDNRHLDRADIIAVGCILVPWIGLPVAWAQHGLAGPFAIWAFLTLLALVIEFLASRSESEQRRAAHRVPDRPRSGVAAVVPRWNSGTALTLAAVLVCGGLVAIAPITPTVNAAFTAHTAVPQNSWTAAVGAPATRLVFVTSPSNSTGGVLFGAQPRVAIHGAQGQATTSTAPVTLAITNPAGAHLTCTANPVAAVSGVAHFAGCRIDQAGAYTLTAIAPNLTPATSATFTVTVGPAAQLVFTTSPGNTARHADFALQPVVAVQDAGGNTVTSSTAAILLTIVNPAGAALDCLINPRAAVAGVATFSGCDVDRVGSYTLRASSGVLSGTSVAFTVFGPATKLTFVANPSNAASGTAFAVQPAVAIQDTAGNTTSGASSITLVITTPAGATLVCAANPRSATNGVAIFSGCAIGQAGTYTLQASASGLTSATSTTFTITPGPASRLVFTTAPATTVSMTAFAAQPVVAVRDAFGNLTTSTAPVTLALTTPGAATLTCTSNPVAAVAGVATFSGCRVDRVGIYTLTATSPGLTAAVSGSFSITVGPAAAVVVTTSPGESTAGVNFLTQPVVTIRDAGGNTVSVTVAVTLTITAPTGGAVLTCSSNPRNTASGVATFSGCRIDRPGTYTLTATSGALTPGVSSPFVVK
jgi:signal peptidase I